MDKHKLSLENDSKALSYGLRGKALSLFSLSWKGHWITPAKEHFQEVGDQPLMTVLEEVFKNLDLVDTCRLWQNCCEIGFDQEVPKKQFFKIFGFPINPRTESLPEVFIKLSDECLQWIRKRRFSFGDFVPILSLTSTEDISRLLKPLSQCDLSRSEGRKALDLLVDLKMMNREVPTASNKIEWMQQLEMNRFPNTQKRDEVKEQFYDSLPKYGNYRGVRQGDQWSHSLTVQFSEHADGVKKLKALVDKMETLNP